MSFILQVLFSLFLAIIAVHIAGMIARVLLKFDVFNHIRTCYYASCKRTGRNKSWASNLLYLSVASTVFTVSFLETGRLAVIVSLS